MGKVRVAKLGDEQEEKKLKKRAEKRRQTKREKKQKVDGVGLKGGERVTVIDGDELKPEAKQVLEEAGQTEQEKKRIKQRTSRIRSKRYLEARKQIDRNSQYPLEDAVSLIKQTSLTKFDGTVELHINLQTQKGKENKDIRGTVTFPHSTGKDVKVEIANDKTVEKVEAGNINFDVLVAHPSMMSKLAKVARTLGPRGLMPNPKNGTVTDKPEEKAKELASGTVNYKSEPGQPIIHIRIGRVSHDDRHLVENIKTMFDAVGRERLESAVISATMGPGVKVAVH